MLQTVPEDPVVPKYVAAERVLREAIQDGHYAPGDKLPAQERLASQLGIAMLTLRRAVDGLVSEGLVERRPRRGTFVTHRSRAPHICLVVFRLPDIRTGSSPWLAMEAIRNVTGSERQVRVMSLPNPLPSPMQVVDELRAMNVGAVGLLNFRNFDLPFVRTLSERVACVLISKNLPGVRLPCAKPNAVEAAQLAVDYLARRKRRRLAVMQINSQHETHSEFAHAVEARMIEHGLTVDRRLWFEVSEDVDAPFPDTAAVARRRADEILRSRSRPDGLILLDVGAADLLRHLQEHGRRNGDDFDAVSVLGGPVRKALPVAAIDLGFDETVGAAAHMLVNLVSDGRDAPLAPVCLTDPKFINPSMGQKAR